MFHVVALSSAATFAESHGAMQTPRPWNNEDSDPTVSTNFKFSKNSTNITMHACDGADPDTHYVLDACFQASAAITFSFQAPPANFTAVIIDCTKDDACNYGTLGTSSTDNDDGALWMYEFLGCKPELMFPITVFKLNEGRCTQFPKSEDSRASGCDGQSCEWFSQGCTIGCEACSERNDDFEHNLCGSTMAPTLPDEFRTWNIDGSILPPSGVASDWTASHPWRSPGNAPVLDACGMAGGSSKDNSAAGGFVPPPHKPGDKGSEVLNTTGTTIWKAGSVVEVSWSIAANHGGGYQYRFCQKDKKLTEECLQQMPLPFASSTQKLRWANGTEVEIPASLVSEGTTPAGSTWVKNPIPACKSMSGGFQEDGCDEPQFPPPPGCNALCWGYQPSAQVPDRDIPTIVDTLQLPDTVLPGRYVLGFRWDCEQTPQIWSSCSDIEVVADSISI
jgi:hypothetical protein